MRALIKTATWHHHYELRNDCSSHPMLLKPINIRQPFCWRALPWFLLSDPRRALAAPAPRPFLAWSSIGAVLCGAARPALSKPPIPRLAAPSMPGPPRPSGGKPIAPIVLERLPGAPVAPMPKPPGTALPSPRPELKEPRAEPMGGFIAGPMPGESGGLVIVLPGMPRELEALGIFACC